jgi:hypothetical protein
MTKNTTKITFEDKLFETNKQMYILKWTNKHGLEVKLTHQYESDIYKFGEVLISEGKEISVCPME